MPVTDAAAAGITRIIHSADQHEYTLRKRWARVWLQLLRRKYAISELDTQFVNAQRNAKKHGAYTYKYTL